MTRATHYHLIGIGGAGMSGLARVLHARGVRVTGSDAADSGTLRALERELGERLSIGNRAENLAGPAPDLIVYSAAIRDDNPELIAGRERGIEVISRADLLGKVMDMYPVRVAVSGTHGKTTTTAMIAQMLAHAGLDPTALVGSGVPAWRSNTLVGSGDLVVAEACEAFGSFLAIRPTHAVITNIEADHLDHYGTLDAVVDAFRRFARQTSDAVICCAEDGAAERIGADTVGKLVTYGIAGGDVRAVETAPGRFEALRGATVLGSVALGVPGRHNILNALASIALGLTLDIPFAKIAEGLAQFTGTERRFELLGQTANGAVIIDDYAHHPTEIRATLAAARERYPGRRVVALFQPHLPSRTQQLMDEFAEAFDGAALVLLTDIYLARENAIPNVSAELLAQMVSKKLGSGRAVYAGNLDQAAAALRSMAQGGDLVLTLGAGDVRRAGELLLAGSADALGSATQTRLRPDRVEASL